MVVPAVVPAVLVQVQELPAKEIVVEPAQAAAAVVLAQPEQRREVLVYIQQ